MRGWKHNFFIYFVAGNKKKLFGRIIRTYSVLKFTQTYSVLKFTVWSNHPG